MIARAASLLTGRSLPPSCRAAYRRELLSSALVPFCIVCLHPDVIGTIARRVFSASDRLIATIAASPHLGHFSVAFTSRWITGRDRVKVLTLARIGILLCVIACALIPATRAGAWIIALLAIVSQAFLALGWVALSDVWRTNYPRSLRATITGRFWIVITLASSVLALALSTALDAGPDRFRWVFVAGAGVGAVGIASMASVRWRWRARTLKEERRRRRANLRRSVAEMIGVLRDDPTYRRYMTAQMVMGAPNLAASAPVIIALDDPLRVSASAALLITFLVPLLATVLTLPLWSALLDRTDIVRFRALHSWVFVVSHVLTAWGVLGDSVLLFVLGRVWMGVGMAGGRIAWTMGHHDLAPPDRAALYMSVHVSLTGLRGVVAPYIGVALFTGITTGAGTVLLPALGGWAFVVFAVASAAGAILFARLWRRVVRGQDRLAGGAPR